MSHESHERADSPKLWLRFAQADLVLAQSDLLPGGLYENLCFLAQQAAEKALKAVLRQYEIRFPYTHNIQVLIDLLPLNMSRIGLLTDATDLTPYATSLRYPIEFVFIKQDEWKRAVGIAASVVKFAETAIAETQQ